MKLGDAFVMKVPPRYIPHLFIVISDPIKNAGTFVIVNLTGDRFRAGKDCILNVGDHSWITKQSFVSFADALEITPSHALRLGKLIAQKKIKLQPGVTAVILKKIVNAGKASSAMAENLKKYL